eukprot:364347-Chlamydomonas_euryale.AAC.20
MARISSALSHRGSRHQSQPCSRIKTPPPLPSASRTNRVGGLTARREHISTRRCGSRLDRGGGGAAAQPMSRLSSGVRDACRAVDPRSPRLRALTRLHAMREALARARGAAVTGPRLHPLPRPFTAAAAAVTAPCALRRPARIGRLSAVGPSRLNLGSASNAHALGDVWRRTCHWRRKGTRPRSACAQPRLRTAAAARPRPRPPSA